MSLQQQNKMEKVLVAYNNAHDANLHTFFEDCADEVKQSCVNNGHEFTDVCPPNLTEGNVVGKMNEHTTCMLAAHGDAYGVYNDNEDNVVTTRTTNYNLSGKVFYAISCDCAQHLLPQLRSIGVSTFVGYDDKLTVIESDHSFVESAVSGLVSLLNGDSKEAAKQKMFDSYTENMNKAISKDIKRILLHNREHLCFE